VCQVIIIWFCFNLVEEIDVDFLQTVDGTELVELVVDLIEDQRLVVVGRVVVHDVVDGLRCQQIDDFDSVEIWKKFI